MVCLSEYLPLRIVYPKSSMSTIGKWFVSRIYRRILREMLKLRRSPRVKVVVLPAVSFQPVPTEAAGRVGIRP